MAKQVRTDGYEWQVFEDGFVSVDTGEDIILLEHTFTPPSIQVGDTIRFEAKFILTTLPIAPTITLSIGNATNQIYWLQNIQLIANLTNLPFEVIGELQIFDGTSARGSLRVIAEDLTLLFLDPIASYQSAQLSVPRTTNTPLKIRAALSSVLGDATLLTNAVKISKG